MCAGGSAAKSLRGSRWGHWWRRDDRTPVAEADRLRPALTPETEDRVLKRQADAIIGVGRILRDLQRKGAIPTTGGDASACGAGAVPVAFAVAAADLDDARQSHAARPADPDTAAALDAATTALGIELERLKDPRSPPSRLLRHLIPTRPNDKDTT